MVSRRRFCVVNLLMTSHSASSVHLGYPLEALDATVEAARLRSSVVATPPPPPPHRAFIAVPPRPVVSFNKGKARALPLPKSGRPILDLQARKKLADQRRRMEASGRADSDEVHRVGDRVSCLIARPQVRLLTWFCFSAIVVARPTRWSVAWRPERYGVASAQTKRRFAVSGRTLGQAVRSCRRKSDLPVVAQRAQSQVSATSRGPQGLPGRLHGSSALLQPLPGLCSWSTAIASRLLRRSRWLLLLESRPRLLLLRRSQCLLLSALQPLRSHKALCSASLHCRHLCSTPQCLRVRVPRRLLFSSTSRRPHKLSPLRFARRPLSWLDSRYSFHHLHHHLRLLTLALLIVRLLLLHLLLPRLHPPRFLSRLGLPALCSAVVPVIAVLSTTTLSLTLPPQRLALDFWLLKRQCARPRWNSPDGSGLETSRTT